jgi:hypothetical protein
VEHRKTRRFTLRLPVALTRAGTQRLAEAGFTKNISSCGVLFTAEHEPDVGGPIEYIITLIGETPNPVNLRCIGKVVRYEKANGDGMKKPFAVAVTMERYEFVRNRPEIEKAQMNAEER